MFESIFIAIFLVGIILMILAIYEESWAFSAMAMLMFIFLGAASMNIEMPYAVTNATSATAITGTYAIQDSAISFVAMMLALINAILLIVFFMDYRKRHP
jgi:uncharacterized ion transporter superfamily protein YfcC